MKACAATLAGVLCTATVAYAGSGSASNTRPDDSDIALELDASRLPTLRATIHAALSSHRPVTLHVQGKGTVDAAGVWPIGEGDMPLAIAFVIDERIRGDVGAAFDRFVPVRVPPGSQLTIVTYSDSAKVLMPLKPVEDVHGDAFGEDLGMGVIQTHRDLTLAIRTAVHEVRSLRGAIPRVILIDAGNPDVPNWHEHPEDANINVAAYTHVDDPVPILTHELHFLDPTYADFDIRALGVFDGAPHTYWITLGDFSTNAVTLSFTRDGKLVPATRRAVTTGVPSTPDWQVALLALAQLAVLVIAYRVALRESPREAKR